jgi:hypothetical protein
MELKDKLLFYLIKTYTNGEIFISKETLENMPEFVEMKVEFDSKQNVTFKIKED